MWLERSNNCAESHEGVGEDEPRLAHRAVLGWAVRVRFISERTLLHIMTTTLAQTLAHASNTSTANTASTAGTGTDAGTDVGAGNCPAPRVRCVLSISSMPRHLRLRVEGLMYEHLSEPAAAPSLVSFWDTPWFTRWRREPSRAGTVSCREVIEAPEEELATFRSALEELAHTFRFCASVA